VVDDEPVNLVVVPMQIFKHMPNAEVQTANLSSVAMNKLTNNQFDVVILDMFMPDMSGQELTQWMRQSGHPHERTLVLALTASSNPDDWRACFQAGMNGVLVKPFDINELLNAIHSHNTRTTRKEA
jgi:CheY-like chemotaxis protein